MIGHPDEITLPPRALRPHAVSQRTTVVTDVGGASQRGHRRRRNEDAWGYRGGRAFVVADGMGGRPRGDDAAAAAVETLLAALDAPVLDADERRRAVDAANAAVLESTSPDRPGGAVVAALQCTEDATTVLHVGDARVHRLRDGAAEPLTRDHTVGTTMAAAGVRASAHGISDRERDALVSFLGTTSGRPTFGTRRLRVVPGDRLVITTDGVHRQLDRATWSLVAAIDAAGDAARTLVEAAVAAGSTDDATAVVVDLDVIELPPPRAGSRRPRR